MSLISLIAAVDEEGGLGFQNQLLCHLPADLAYFKKNTLGKPVIMGRGTYESIGKPLPNRPNFILTHAAVCIPGATVVHSLEQALRLNKDAAEIMIIGGVDIYTRAMPITDRLEITEVHARIEGDTRFPPIDAVLWRETGRTRHAAGADDTSDYSYVTYCRQQPN